MLHKTPSDFKNYSSYAITLYAKMLLKIPDISIIQESMQVDDMKESAPDELKKMKGFDDLMDKLHNR